LHASLKSSLQVFHAGHFANFWLGRFLSTMATFMLSVTLGWQVYTIARQSHSIEQSSFLVGMIGLVQFLPLFALTLPAGAAADRYDRRKILLGATILQLSCAAGLAGLAWSAHPALPLIFLAAALFGTARAFIIPATSALAPMLVNIELLPRAIAWNSLGMQGGMVLGPWIGGVLCGISTALSYAVAAGLYLCALTAFVRIRGNTRPGHRGGSRLTMIREGLIYIWSNKVVFGAISLDLVAVLLGGVTALLPVYAHDILRIGPGGFGLLRSGPAIGGGLMALLLSVRPIHRHAGSWMLGAVSVFGLATIVFAVSRNLTLSLVALVVLGAADVISVFIRQSLVQVVTPDPMRGRVSAVSGMFISASNELGEFESGVVARLAGPVGSALLGGIGSIVVTRVWARLFPALRKADRLETPGA
jgi:MFS family permease